MNPFRLALPAILLATVGLLPAQRSNVAWAWGTATQSSTLNTMVATLATDRSHSGNNALCCNPPYANTPSIACTNNLPLSWWQVSLLQPAAIDEVLIWNRADNQVERLSNFRVELFLAGNLVFREDFYTNGGHVPSGGHVRVVPGNAPLSADLCRITKIGPSPLGDHFLQLAEVELWSQSGYAPPNYYLTNVAPYGTATTSMTGIGSPGVHVVNDGNSDGWAPNGSTFWTLSFPGSWVRIDLPTRVTLRGISLYNRIDALLDRMSRYRVRVFDGATQTATFALETTTMPAMGKHYSWNTTTTLCTHVIVDSVGQGLTAEEIVQLAEIELWAMNYNFNIMDEALPFGAPCEATTGPLRARCASGQPRLGTTLTTQVVNALPIGGGQSVGLLVTGFSATQAFGQPLPLFLGAPGIPACTLLTSPDFLDVGVATGTVVPFSYVIPNNFSLLNARMWQQAMLIDPSTTYPNGIVLGSGLRVTIGL